MTEQFLDKLSRRERQIMDIVFRNEKVTAAQVLQELPDPPSYSAIRALLRILEDKGYLSHEQDGPRYVFFPKVNREKARRSMVKNLLDNFFDNSMESVVATLLDVSKEQLCREDLDRLGKLIEAAKQEENQNV